MSYFDLVPKEVITEIIYPKLDSASRFTLWEAYHTAEDYMITTNYSGGRSTVNTYKWSKGKFVSGAELLPDIYIEDICLYDINFLNYFVDREMIDKHLMYTTASISGNLKLVMSLKSTHEFHTRISDMANCALEHGNTDILVWLYKNYNIINVDRIAIVAALLGGHYDCVEIVKDKCNFISRWSLDQLASRGSIKSLNWLKEYKDPEKWECDTYELISSAIRGNNLNNVKWLHETFNVRYEYQYFALAVQYTKLNIIKFYYDKGCQMHEDAFDVALNPWSIIPENNPVIDLLVALKCPGYEKYVA